MFRPPELADPDLVRLPIGTPADVFMLGLCLYQVGLVEQVDGHELILILMWIYWVGLEKRTPVWKPPSIK